MVLACDATYEVLINDRRGSPTIARITEHVERLEYHRVLDATAEATITLSTGCCEELNLIAPLRHTVMVKRDGKVAWEGMLLLKEEGGVRRTSSGRISTGEDRVGADIATLTAYDFTNWLDVRAVRDPIEDTLDPIRYLKRIVVAGLEPDDPNLIEHLDFRFGMEPIAIKIGAYEATVGQELRRLAKQGVDFTAIGRRIAIFPASEFLGYAGLLRDEDFLAVPLIVDDGGSYTSRAVVNANGFTEAASVDSPYYGLVERIYQDDRVTTGAAAFQSAVERLGNLGGVVPRYIILTTDATVAPNAGVGLDKLWPGSKLDIYLTERCARVYQSFKLSEVHVTVDEEGERIGLSTIPYGDAVAEGDVPMPSGPG